MLVHASLLLAVSLTVFGGRASSFRLANSALTARGAIASSALDEMAAAKVAASIAGKTDLLITGQATRQAAALSTQVPLPTISEGTLAKRQVVTTEGDATRGITTYAVNHGDTLGAIASKFNITTSTLVWANNLDDSDALKPGQKLTILPVSGLLYKIQPGDTAESLAAKYQANAAQILSYNNAEIKGFAVNQQIIIPDGIKPAAPRPRVTVAVATTASAPVAAQSNTALTKFSASGNNYSYGYCTWYVANRRAVPGNWGNASNWLSSARASGFGTGRTPVPGAIAWSSGMSYWGHVGIVEKVEGDRVLVSDMNGPAGWGRVSTYWTSASTWGGYIY